MALICGINASKYGSKSLLLEMSEHIDPTITAAGRFTSVFFARSPRWRMGTMRASDGESMAWTKLVSVNAVNAAPVFSIGFVSASISTSLRQLAYDLQSHLEVEKAAYSGYLLENYIDFEVIVNSLVGGYEAKWGESGELDNEQEIGVREKSMFNTFAKFYPHLKGNVFGQWGSMHVRQDTTGIERLNDETETWTNPETFAYQLNHHPNSPVRGKVISIGYNYVNCFTSQLNRQHTDERIPTKSILDKVTENELIETSESDFTLFRLNSGNSPFTDLSADFQYILLIQNQLAQ